MMNSQALIPIAISRAKNKSAASIIAVIGGVLLMTVLAQVVIPLPWTPVPITGQTFGVALTALLFGRSRAIGIMGIYLGMGFLGLPVFAQASGATLGYLAGMAVASFVVGELSDRGWTNSFGKSIAAAYLGSFFIFSLGLLGLSFYLPKESLLMAGLIPFLPGDAIKNTLAALISYKSKKYFLKS